MENKEQRKQTIKTMKEIWIKDMVIGIILLFVSAFAAIKEYFYLFFMAILFSLFFLKCGDDLWVAMCKEILRYTKEDGN